MITVNSRQEFLIEMKQLLPEKCKGVELGVYEGVFARDILSIINPLSLILVDPFKINNETYGEALNYLPTSYGTEDDYQNLIKKFYEEILQGQVLVVRKFSYEVASFSPDGIYDFVYIDASHKFEDVKRDLNDWLPKIKEGGLLSGHDHTIFPDFGVIEAVAEFCKEQNFDMIIYNTNGGDWALRKTN